MKLNKEARLKEKVYIIIQKEDKIIEMVQKESFGLSTTKYFNNDIICFEKLKEAKEWIKQHTYKGMTCEYKIKKVSFNYKLDKWEEI